MAQECVVNLPCFVDCNTFAGRDQEGEIEERVKGNDHIIDLLPLIQRWIACPFFRVIFHPSLDVFPQTAGTLQHKDSGVPSCFNILDHTDWKLAIIGIIFLQFFKFLQSLGRSIDRYSQCSYLYAISLIQSKLNVSDTI